jgi:hypothetical protein
MGQRIAVKKSQQRGGPPMLAGAALYLLDRALMIAAAGVGVSIIYLLHGLISGVVTAFPHLPNGEMMTPAVREQALHNLRIAAYVFMGGLWGITLVSVFRFRENDVAGYVGALGGIVCYLGLPWLVGNALMQHNADANAATDFMLASFRVTGKVLLSITAVYFAFKVVARLSSRGGAAPAAAAPVGLDSDKPKSREAPKLTRRQSALRKCWDLSACRDSLRENCPSYKLGVACWKRGTGCQCDPALAQRLVEELEANLHGDMSEKERLARERMRDQLTYRIAEHQGNAFCRDCVIYNEHQYYKYKYLFWIAYPITVALVFLLRPLIHRAYVWTDTGIASLLDSLRMLPRTDAALRPFMHTVYNFNAEIIFVISAAMIIAAYLLDLMDYAFFQAKI